MKTALVLFLIALVPVVLGMLVLKTVLFYVLVVPKVTKKGFRFWLNTLLGDTNKIHIRAYLEQLTDEQRQKWRNWFLANASFLIGGAIFLWMLALLLAR